MNHVTSKPVWTSTANHQHNYGLQKNSLLAVKTNIFPFQHLSLISKPTSSHYSPILVPPIAIPRGPANASAMLEFKSVSAAEVKRMLSDLVTSKAPGPDGILPSELKLVAGDIAPTIAILFNESLATGLLPEQFRIANLVSVFSNRGKLTHLLQTTTGEYLYHVSCQKSWRNLSSIN